MRMTRLSKLFLCPFGVKALFVMILMFGTFEQGKAASESLSTTGPQSASVAPPASDSTVAAAPAPVIKHAIPLFKAQVKPARVRIGIELTPYRRILTQKVDGQAQAKFVATDSLQHTLRARLDQSNHFFVGDYHIATHPVSWDSDTRRYVIRLSISQRYGAAGTLEEAIGTITADGTLVGDPRVYNLQATAQQRFHAKTGQFQLDVRILPPAGENSPAPTIQANKDSGASPRSL